MAVEGTGLLQLDSVTFTGKEIGRGSYGRVMEVSTFCAAKELHTTLFDASGSQKLKDLFIQECYNSSQLYHPNIVQFLGIYYPSKDVKLPWPVMERMDCSLTHYLKTHKRDEVPFQVKMSILNDISLGLKYLHVQDIIHRDLSSNNVLLSKYLVAKIGGLGVAKVINPDHTKTGTQAPDTTHFMPPEALSVNPHYGKPVDVFSFGCVMIHTMTHDWPAPKDETLIDKSSGKK